MPTKKETTTVLSAKTTKAAKATKVAQPVVATAKTNTRTTAKTPRVTNSKHSKVSPSTPAAALEASVAVQAAEIAVENPHEIIAALAYGYWESRGFQGGSHLDDWFRAETEYRERYA